jgi:hypothetical protein
MSGKYSAEWWQRIAQMTGEFVQKNQAPWPARRTHDNRKNEQRDKTPAMAADFRVQDPA